MIKRTVSLILCIISLVSFCSMPKAEAANEGVKTQLIRLYNKFPHGKYWNHVGSSKNNPDGVTSKPCPNHYSCSWKRSCYCNKFDNAIQCMGYAYKIAYEIVGVSPREYTKSYKLDASKLRVGDVIRYKRNTHSITVTGVKGNRISFTDANWSGRCQIRWSEMNLSEIKGFSYVLHYKNNNRKNSDLKFYKSAVQPDNTEIWKNVSVSSLNIRKDHDLSADLAGSVPAGEKFYVYRHYADGEYLWGKIKYGAYTGWCALNWSEYVSANGKTPKPTFKSVQEKYYYEDAVLRWNKVEGADRYVLKIYDKDGEFVKKYYTENLKRSLDIKESGTYKAKVFAVSNQNGTWMPQSNEITFKLTAKKPVYVNDFEMKNKLTMVCGKSKTLSFAVLPENASDKEVIWESSDPSIVTVSQKGKITAKKCGKVKITCTSEDKNGYSETCTVTVKPAKVQKLKQTDSRRDTKIGLQWNAAKGATYYSIYMYNGKEYEKIGQIKDTGCTIEELNKNKTYYFKILAVYKKGKTVITGDFSDKLKATA